MIGQEVGDENKQREEVVDAAQSPEDDGVVLVRHVDYFGLGAARPYNWAVRRAATFAFIF